MKLKGALGGLMVKTKHFICFLCLLTAPSAHADVNAFWQIWSDGKAEVNAYQVSQKRYNELRTGSLFLIYVTEPFSKSRQVKVDYYDPKNADHTIALKLNIVESFRTGIYDYRLMTSHFVDAADALAPLKSVFSSQEWCGTTYEQINWLSKDTKLRVMSYFEGESLETTLPKQARLIDSIFIYGRALQRGGPRNGTSFPKRWIESAKQRLLSHRTAHSYLAKPSYGSIRTLPSILGQTAARSLAFQRASGALCTLEIEVPPPHRILGWQCSDGEYATLTGSIRTAYWGQTKEKDISILKQLGVQKP